MHFTVLVVGKDFEKALAPFQENNMGDCPKEYLQFTSVRKHLEEQYAEEQAFYRHKESGKVEDRWTDKINRTCSEEEYRDWNGPKGSRYSDGKPVCYVQDPEGTGYEKIQGTWALIYPTLEEYLKAECVDEWDEESRDYGYWENPDAKWDWYQTGGRWAGSLLLKEGVQLTPEHLQNGEAWCLDPTEDHYGKKDPQQRVDAARVSEVHFEAMDAEVVARLSAQWDDWVADNVRLKSEEELQAIYAGLDTADTYEEWKAGREKRCQERLGLKLGAPFDDYADLHGRHWAPYHLLMGGIWYEDKRDISTLLLSLRENSPDEWITMVDCHI